VCAQEESAETHAGAGIRGLEIQRPGLGPHSPRASKVTRSSPPTLCIHQASPTSRNSTVSPFVNLAPACRPLITMSTTVASANDFRNCHEAGVQFLIGRPPMCWQPIRSQPGWVMYVHVPDSGPRRSPPAKNRAHSFPARSISCSAERLGLLEGVDPIGFGSLSFDGVVLGPAVSLSEERSASTPATTNSTATPPTTSQVMREGCRIGGALHRRD